MSNDGWFEVAATVELDDDDVMKVTAGEAILALYRIDGQFYATADRCTHEEASLSDGWVQDGTIECPRHQGVFDIVSGKALVTPASVEVRTFPTRVEGERVYIQVRET